MRLVVCYANRLAFLHTYFEVSSSFLQKYKCIQPPPAALSQFFQIWAVFCTNPVATISFRSFLHSLSLPCHISVYFSVEQSTTIIDVTSCFGAFDVRPEERMHGANFNPGSTKVCVYITFSKI